MLNYDGVDDKTGVPWSVKHQGGRKFVVKVGDQEREYEAVYEPIFGMDVEDFDRMNRMLDEMYDDLN